MKWLTNLFKSEQPKPKVVAKPEPKKEVLNYRELATIAGNNARYLRALINTKEGFINSLGKREAKKRQGQLTRLREKLAEEEFYAEYYKNPAKFHSEGV